MPARAWIDGDDTARWRSASAHVGAASGSSLLEADPGCRLPRHVVTRYESAVQPDGERERRPLG
jgi:hypothetical protein